MIKSMIFLTMFCSTILISGEAKCINVEGISPYIDTNHSLSKDDVLKYNLKVKICRDSYVKELERIASELQRKHFKMVANISSIDYRMRVEIPLENGSKELWFSSGMSSVSCDGKFFFVDKKGVRVLRAYFQKTIAEFMRPKLPEPK